MSAAWTFEEARKHCQEASRKQRDAEDALKEANLYFAKAEESYRLELAQEIVRQHDSGVAWSVAPDLARGQAKVAELRRKRDISEGVREAMTHAAWRRNADRRDAQRFSDWSQRRDIAEGLGQGPEPDWDAPRPEVPA